MLLGKRKKERSVEIPTASLADISFLILTFFLLTTTINIDKGLGLTLPAKGEQKKVRKENVTNLLINARGQVLLDGQMVDIGQIKQIIRQKLAERPQLIVSVKTDRNTKYEVYIKVLDQLKQAGATRISIAEPE
ncbi:MAG TPA: biopolymer transporter ExbD [Bacteroidetes bacterium]|nr:biopolymer transporter ExbD [Bacteroidota bacterium]